MKCLICNSKAEYFFSKSYIEEPFSTFMEKIGTVDYHKCTTCGFTMSKTHYGLTESTWEKLNFDYHTFSEKAKAEKQSKGNPPPYVDQATMINILSKRSIIDSSSMLDFAGGYGTLSKALHRYHAIDMPIYDPYMSANNECKYIDKVDLSTYNTVINSALFEHVTSRHDLDEINAIVSDTGCMIIHTVVAENVPMDPDWFYIRIPVHCTFHTNKSMALLMEQWGYLSSIYCPSSKCWVLFKKERNDIIELVNEINAEFQHEYLLYKKGFVGYWKGF